MRPAHVDCSDRAMRKIATVSVLVIAFLAPFTVLGTTSVDALMRVAICQESVNTTHDDLIVITVSCTTYTFDDRPPWDANRPTEVGDPAAGGREFGEGRDATCDELAREIVQFENEYQNALADVVDFERRLAEERGTEQDASAEIRRLTDLIHAAEARRRTIEQREPDVVQRLHLWIEGDESSPTVQGQYRVDLTTEDGKLWTVEDEEIRRLHAEL